jgi:hypothetical protein
LPKCILHILQPPSNQRRTLLEQNKTNPTITTITRPLSCSFRAPFICCCDDGSLHPIRYVCPFRINMCVFYRYVVCCDIDVRFCPSNRYCYFDQFCRVNTVEGSTLFTHSPTASLARQVVSARLVMSSIHRAAGMLAVCWFCASVREFI